jgi:hypothetical protein
VIISARRIVAAWLPVRTAVAERRGTALKRTLWVMVAPLALYVALLAHAVALAWGLQVQSGIAYIFMGLFGIALRNSWDLLVELHVFPLSSTRKDP